jgi:hypothetical protein
MSDSENATFDCPRCGGVHFGTTWEAWRDGVKVPWRSSDDLRPGDDLRLVAYECHNRADGSPFPPPMEFGGPRVKACGWKGSPRECGMEDTR